MHQRDAGGEKELHRSSVARLEKRAWGQLYTGCPKIRRGSQSEKAGT
jgi:hypothetical protein